jgi:hypothetical protein
VFGRGLDERGPVLLCLGSWCRLVNEAVLQRFQSRLCEDMWLSVVCFPSCRWESLGVILVLSSERRVFSPSREGIAPLPCLSE